MVESTKYQFASEDVVWIEVRRCGVRMYLIFARIAIRE